jgi:hypothetical protein
MNNYFSVTIENNQALASWCIDGETFCEIITLEELAFELGCLSDVTFRYTEQNFDNKTFKHYMVN